MPGRSAIQLRADHKNQAWQDGHSRFRKFNEGDKAGEVGSVMGLSGWTSSTLNTTIAICGRIPAPIASAFPLNQVPLAWPWLGSTLQGDVSG